LLVAFDVAAGAADADGVPARAARAATTTRPPMSLVLSLAVVVGIVVSRAP
jgi:hypothetical protein